MISDPLWEFRIEWDVFTKKDNLPPKQANIQLYNCADETVQNDIINTYPEFFHNKPRKLLDMRDGACYSVNGPHCDSEYFIALTISRRWLLEKF